MIKDIELLLCIMLPTCSSLWIPYFLGWPCHTQTFIVSNKCSLPELPNLSKCGIFMKAMVSILPTPTFLWLPQHSICKIHLSISPQGFTLSAFYLVKISCILMLCYKDTGHSSASTCLSPVVYAGMFKRWILNLIGLCIWKLQKYFCSWGMRQGGLGCAPCRKPVLIWVEVMEVSIVTKNEVN